MSATAMSSMIGSTLLVLAVGISAAPAEPATGTVAAADGVPIRWESQGSGEPTLVMVHCWACDRQFFKEQVDDLASDHRVVTLDLPGHGESGAERESWSIAGLSADVVRVVEELELEQVVLAGHSMGGPISLGAAPQLADRVIGVVLIDTVHDADQVMPAEMVERIVTAYTSDYEGTMRQFTPMMFPPGADPELPAWVLERALRADREATLALMRDFEDVDNAALLSGAGVPVRAINAAASPPMIPETAVEANRRYADFDATIIDGVGHYLLLEKPAEFNRALRDALSQIATARH